MDHESAHVCPRPERGMLPSKVIEDATAGRVEEISKWLSQGGDVNASDLVDQTLLHFACQEEQPEVVKMLLEHPDIHLNTRMNTKDGLTPLCIASTNGHRDIVEMLLKAQNKKCVADPTILVGGHLRNTRASAVVLATQGKHWPTLRVILNYYHNIRESEAFYAICKAVEDYEFDIAEKILGGNFAFRDQDFGTPIQEAYFSKKWEVVEAIFRKNLSHNNDFSKKLLHLLVVQKDWKNVESLLRLMNDKATIHIVLVEAILGKREKDDVEKLLKEVQKDEETMAGTLLAATIGGTSQELADLLLNDETVAYSDKTLDNALILSSMNLRLEFLPLLLLKKKFTYQILSRSRVASVGVNRADVNSLLQTVLEERAKEYSQNQKMRSGSEADSTEER